MGAGMVFPRTLPSPPVLSSKAVDLVVYLRTVSRVWGTTKKVVTEVEIVIRFGVSICLLYSMRLFYQMHFLKAFPRKWMLHSRYTKIRDLFLPYCTVITLKGKLSKPRRR